MTPGSLIVSPPELNWCGGENENPRQLKETSDTKLFQVAK